MTRERQTDLIYIRYILWMLTHMGMYEWDTYANIRDGFEREWKKDEQ